MIGYYPDTLWTSVPFRGFGFPQDNSKSAPDVHVAWGTQLPHRQLVKHKGTPDILFGEGFEGGAMNSIPVWARMGKYSLTSVLYSNYNTTHTVRSISLWIQFVTINNTVCTKSTWLHHKPVCEFKGFPFSWTTRWCHPKSMFSLWEGEIPETLLPWYHSRLYIYGSTNFRMG